MAPSPPRLASPRLCSALSPVLISASAPACMAAAGHVLSGVRWRAYMSAPSMYLFFWGGAITHKQIEYKVRTRAEVETGYKMP